jgi:transcription elongation factor SPT4
MVKKIDKYITVNSDGEEVSDSEEESVISKSQPAKSFEFNVSDEENADPVIAREQQKLSNAPLTTGRQPRQEPRTVEQSARLANALFPQSTNEDTATYNQNLTSTVFQAPSKQPPRSDPWSLNVPPTHRKTASGPRGTPTETNRARRTANPNPASSSSPRQRPNLPSSTQDNNDTLDPDDPDTMVHESAFIPPNQQRHMRACMVCSIVRTQQQFQLSGCPNCEHFLELTGNSEAVAECTSQVFEGLISVADTSRSWVARFQRLEGYVTGVYATQVEGILPEDVLAQVEAAGINYVPRDGSEQDMLGKE